MQNLICVPDAQRAGISLPDNNDEYVYGVCTNCKSKRVVFNTPKQIKSAPVSATQGDPNLNICEACQ